MIIVDRRLRNKNNLVIKQNLEFNSTIIKHKYKEVNMDNIFDLGLTVDSIEPNSINESGCTNALCNSVNSRCTNYSACWDTINANGCTNLMC